MAATVQQLATIRAYNQGYRAFLDWKLLDANPHPAMSADARNWEAGWHSAQRINKQGA